MKKNIISTPFFKYAVISFTSVGVSTLTSYCCRVGTAPPNKKYYSPNKVVPLNKLSTIHLVCLLCIVLFHVLNYYVRKSVYSLLIIFSYGVVQVITCVCHKIYYIWTHHIGKGPQGRPRTGWRVMYLLCPGKASGLSRRSWRERCLGFSPGPASPATLQQISCRR